MRKYAIVANTLKNYIIRHYRDYEIIAESSDELIINVTIQHNLYTITINNNISVYNEILIRIDNRQCLSFNTVSMHFFTTECRAETMEKSFIGFIDAYFWNMN